MIDGIDHLVITVADLAVTLAFYERVLGFRAVIEQDRPAALHFGTQKINVHQVDRTFEPKAKRPVPGSADVCLVTPWRPERVTRHLADHGVPVECGPVARRGARGAMTSHYIRDPDSNLIEISTYAEANA